MAPKKARDARSVTPGASASTTSSLPPATQKARLEAKKRESGGSSSLSESFNSLWTNYNESTPYKLKLLDAYQLFLMLSGIVQFIYCILVTNFPFNAFIAGFASTVGQFVLTASLRSQVNPANKATFPNVSPERAFGDFVFGSLILHFFVWNYLG